MIFNIKSIEFDENYHPKDNTRITTNFANLARGQYRKENLRNALKMIDSRFNALAHWDNPKGCLLIRSHLISPALNISLAIR